MGKMEDLMGVGISAGAANVFSSDFTTGSKVNIGLRDGGTQLQVKKVSFGALPNSGSDTEAHELTDSDNVIHYWGVARHSSNGTILILPYSDPTAGNNIKLQLNGTNISITTGADWSSYSADVYLVLKEE